MAIYFEIAFVQIDQKIALFIEVIFHKSIHKLLQDDDIERIHFNVCRKWFFHFVLISF